MPAPFEFPYFFMWSGCTRGGHPWYNKPAEYAFETSAGRFLTFSLRIRIFTWYSMPPRLR